MGAGPEGDEEENPIRFADKDLIGWFKIYNTTQLQKAKKYLDKQGGNVNA